MVFGIDFKEAWASPLTRLMIITMALAVLSGLSAAISVILLITAPLHWQLYCIPFLAVFTSAMIFFRDKVNILLAAEGCNDRI